MSDWLSKFSFLSPACVESDVGGTPVKFYAVKAVHLGKLRVLLPILGEQPIKGKITSLGKIAGGVGPRAADVVELLLARVGRRDLEATSPRFFCGCNEERVLRAVSLLGRRDLDDASARGEQLEVRCAFCADRYAVDPERARALLQDA